MEFIPDSERNLQKTDSVFYKNTSLITFRIRNWVHWFRLFVHSGLPIFDSFVGLLWFNQKRNLEYVQEKERSRSFLTSFTLDGARCTDSEGRDNQSGVCVHVVPCQKMKDELHCTAKISTKDLSRVGSSKDNSTPAASCAKLNLTNFWRIRWKLKRLCLSEDLELSLWQLKESKEGSRFRSGILGMRSINCHGWGFLSLTSCTFHGRSWRHRFGLQTQLLT